MPQSNINASFVKFYNNIEVKTQANKIIFKLLKLNCQHNQTNNLNTESN